MEQNVSTEKKSSEVIVVTSGKGGVGKTTTSANVGTGLAKVGAVKSASSIRISDCAISMLSWDWRTVSYIIWWMW